LVTYFRKSPKFEIKRRAFIEEEGKENERGRAINRKNSHELERHRGGRDLEKKERRKLHIGNLTRATDSLRREQVCGRPPTERGVKSEGGEEEAVPHAANDATGKR